MDNFDRRFHGIYDIISKKNMEGRYKGLKTNIDKIESLWAKSKQDFINISNYLILIHDSLPQEKQKSFGGLLLWETKKIFEPKMNYYYTTAIDLILSTSIIDDDFSINLGQMIDKIDLEIKKAETIYFMTSSSVVIFSSISIVILLIVRIYYSEKLYKAVRNKEREMIVLMDKNINQDKLATIGQLSGNIAHEIRNPLGAISINPLPGSSRSTLK